MREGGSEPIPSVSLWLLRQRHGAWDEGEGHARPGKAREGAESAGPRRPRLTWEGVVTLISGTNVSSNKLRICSCLTSLDGVCLGGGGTGGPFRSCGSAAGEGAAWKGTAERGGWGRQTETKPRLVTSRTRPHQQPRNTDEESHCPPKTPTHRPHGPPGAAEAWRSGALHREKWVGGQGSERQETRREQDREEGKTGLPGCQGPRWSIRLSRPLVGKLRRETAPRPPAPAPGGAAVQTLEVTVEAAHLPVKPGLPHSSS